jgi:endonuclease/exonuclease/phosphatase family metal-dependent hydrolase
MNAIYRLIEDEIAPHFPELCRRQSTAELLADPLYGSLEPAIRTVLETPHVGGFGAGPAKPRYRVLAWNIERGTQLDAQLEAFRSHEYLKQCDVILLTEADVGMARSGNREVAPTIARELGFCYAFIPCYLNFSKGSGVERDIAGENNLGLHGNAVLSRYPITNIRGIRLKNGTDKMAGQEKRLGSQVAVAVDIDFPNYRLTAVAVHLDAQSSQRHRRDQMRDVVDALSTDRPVILGGDWNTTTYNSSRALHTILGFWLRVFMGADNVIRNHYLRPYDRFEKELFALLESRGFDYRQCNRLGEGTVSYDVEDPRARGNLREWVPAWCFPFVRWALRKHGGKCRLKLDWFASRGAHCENPVVLNGLVDRRGTPLSDHDPIGVAVVVPG